jgi:CPA2 family monovalent cation:H+ antiporter-2
MVILKTLMVYGGTRIIPILLKRIAQWNLRDLFIIAITALGLGVGYVTYLFGLSFAFGAFIAGEEATGGDIALARVAATML